MRTLALVAAVLLAAGPGTAQEAKRAQELKRERQPKLTQGKAQRPPPVPLTSGAFSVDRSQIADPRLPAPAEPERFGQGRIDNTMRWKLGRERPPPEARTPDPFFNRGQ